MIGRTLGSYDVTARLGTGGMGEVYRARDAKLDRDVAIKVLPADLAQDAERLARFEREAKLLASLNHSNIAHVYGFESAVLDDGSSAHFLAMELVEGEDLAERLKRGAIPVDEALAVARQIADALEEAHEKGIVHRDLKPANIKLTPDGKVKVLDFGLAKAYAAESASGSGSRSDLSQSPTLAHTGTQAGLLLGTAAYMSPEQARGRPVDKRTDIWAFGVVLYEMLTGKQLFEGETVSDVLAGVLTRDPDWTDLPGATPTSVGRLLRRCLVRDPRERLHDIADARLDLQEPGAPAEGTPAVVAKRAAGWLASTVLASASVLAGAAVAWWLAGSATIPSRDDLLRFEIPLPQGVSLVGGISLSRDGRSLAFSGLDAEGRTAIWVRSMDELAPRRLDGTDDGRFPFWSPDGRQIGFFAGRALRVMDLISQTPRDLAPTPISIEARGATWGAEDVIVYTGNSAGALSRVGAQGGEPQPATALETGSNTGTHRWPSFLPDGRHFVFYASPGGGTEPGELRLGQVESTEHRRLVAANSGAAFLPPDSLVYVSGQTLVRQRFDLDRLELQGDPVPLGPELPRSFGLAGFRALSAAAGIMAYQVGAPAKMELVWFDRGGEELGTVPGARGELYNPRLEPNGERIAVSAYDKGVGQVWIADFTRNSWTQVTFGASQSHWSAVWSPDGRRLAMAINETTEMALYVMDSGREGSEQRLRSIHGLWSVDAWLPGEDAVAATTLDPETQGDIQRLALAPDAELEPLVATPANEQMAEPSPDGRWLAYVSDASGRDEVYVRRLDEGAEVWRVSSEGATAPGWRRDGRELFFVDTKGMLHAVPVTLGESFAAGPAEALFVLPTDPYAGGRQYAVSADSRRILVVRAMGVATDPIVVVKGWRPPTDGSVER